MGPRRQYVDDLPDAPVELHIYPGRDGSFLLYEDEGDGYGYEQGAFATILVEWDNRARNLRLGPRQGGYPGMPETRKFTVVLHGEQQAGTQPRSATVSEILYDGRPTGTAF